MRDEPKRATSGEKGNRSPRVTNPAIPIENHMTVLDIAAMSRFERSPHTAKLSAARTAMKGYAGNIYTLRLLAGMQKNTKINAAEMKAYRCRSLAFLHICRNALIV
jgi:hypothetical protein